MNSNNLTIPHPNSRNGSLCANAGGVADLAEALPLSEQSM